MLPSMVMSTPVVDIDSSGHAEVGGNQTDQDTDVARAISYIKAIEDGINQYRRGHGLSISEHRKLISDINTLKSLDRRYMPQVERLRKVLKEAILSCENAMLQAEEQPGERVYLHPSTDGFQKAERQRGRVQLFNVAARSEKVQELTEQLRQLSIMFQDLCTQVEDQETAVEAIQNDTEQTKIDLENANTELTKTIGYRRLARRYKWWIFLVVSAIVIAIILAFAVTQA
ncbi:hypothetical protein BJX66DRAFT_320934 [Aspergillus keveii]|uniref:t-SNARE coiled-coil homology domain-containing protein n=1 Tax=Aspergillus keveii TaxID=714993 RepID=A0ABR4FGZ5_9EURO